MQARVPGMRDRGLGCSPGPLVQSKAHKNAEQESWVQAELLGVGKGPRRRTQVPGVQSRALRRRWGSWLWIEAPMNAAMNPGGVQSRVLGSD